MIHLLCDCGALVSAPLAPGPRAVACKACGKDVPVPDPGTLGFGEDPAPAPGPAPSPVPPAPPGPRFDADDRLDLHALEREAARLLVMGRMGIAGGLVGAGAAAAVPGLGLESRVFAGAAALFAAVAAWTLFRGARAACLAAVALAQRQREILRRLS